MQKTLSQFLREVADIAEREGKSSLIEGVAIIAAYQDHFPSGGNVEIHSNLDHGNVTKLLGFAAERIDGEGITEVPYAKIH